MIACRLTDAMVEGYKNVHPRMKAALEALQKLAASNPADGRYEIDGDNIYANVGTGTTRLAKDAKFEMHKKYIDIQCVIEGQEIIGNETTDKLVPVNEYQADGDYQLFEMNNEYDPMIVSAGELMIIFADEPHCPSLAVNDTPAKVKKIIVKVLQ